MKHILESTLVPPLAACRYGCGTNCTPVIAVFWLFGLVSVIFGLLGGPTSEPGISWYTVGLGLILWGIAAVWTLLTLQGVESRECQGIWGRAQPAGSDESDPLEEVKKAL